MPADQHNAGQTADTTEPLFPEHRLPAAIEALLLASDKPLKPARIATALGLPADKDTEQRLEQLTQALNRHYDDTDRSFRIEQLAGGYRIVTKPEFAPALAAIHGLQASTRLSRAALETLAIVAYKQPITRADIEAIRGVACGEVLKGLLDKKLVTIAGRAEELGRPILYGTTQRFLEAFGLATTNDLPKIDDLFPGLIDPDDTTTSTQNQQNQQPHPDEQPTNSPTQPNPTPTPETQPETQPKAEHNTP